jgi:MoaA/NifB/PqqE/SkfB family radical SAM enzyme
MILPLISIDIEPTNRCNASCYFCPRDQTPHQGLMKPEVFEQALVRAVEFRPFAQTELGKDVQVSLCGLGEPLLNKHTPSYVHQVREAGFTCSMASNGALLTEKAGAELLDAGLDSIQINVGEQGERYEEIYKLPWERTLENVARFGEMAMGRCRAQIVLVDHQGDPDHIRAMVAFWKSHGLDDFVFFGLINRGGALFVDHMQYESYPEQAAARNLLAEGRDQPVVCQAPFSLLFVGYDGQYYLCCSDWKKEAPLGSVFEASFVDVAGAKLAHVSGREPVCKSCNHDPLNRVTEELRLIARGQADHVALDEVLADVLESDTVVRQFVTATGTDPASVRPRRPLIPVRPA